jgi:hypothetical protein
LFLEGNLNLNPMVRLKMVNNPTTPMPCTVNNNITHNSSNMVDIRNMVQVLVQVQVDMVLERNMEVGDIKLNTHQHLLPLNPKFKHSFLVNDQHMSHPKLERLLLLWRQDQMDRQERRLR